MRSAEPRRGWPAAAPVDPEMAAAFLAPGGAVARNLGRYEHRPEQIEMLGAVATAFNDDAILAVEAGTGVGKSLAYLLPAILWSRANRAPVIVSTHTINLQEQLVGKDLPLLTRGAGLECLAVLVKGRSNYLCRRKAAQAAAQESLLVEDELRQDLRRVLEWAGATTDGSLSDLGAPPRPEVWEHVVSEDDNCLRARCPYYDACFFYAARRAATKANILVVNHHLLMADLAVRRLTGRYDEPAVLPPANRLVLDEAHHVDDVATAHFGGRLSLSAVGRSLDRLFRERPPHRGVLLGLRAAIEAARVRDRSPVAESLAREIEERLIPRRGSLARETEEIFGELTDALEIMLGRPLGEVPEKLRVTAELQGEPFWGRCVRLLERLAAALSSYASELAAVAERLDDLGERAGQQAMFLNTELGALAGRVAGYAEALRGFARDDPGMCRWIEAASSRRGPSVVLNTAPIEVGPALREAAFDRFATVVLTSATLAVGGSFEHLRRRLGLEASDAGDEASLSLPRKGRTQRGGGNDAGPQVPGAERLRELVVASPFDYARQAMLAIPGDLPAPSDAGFDAASHRFMSQLVRIAGGGTFLLFTSYAALDRAWEALEPGLAAEGYVLLRQGSTSRERLLARFCAGSRAVLFATDSFWEGVDVRGDALRAVAIAKLPFAVPTEPIRQARHEAIAARGGNPFAEETVPQAVIKLKQGFGRLIRSRDDRGAVVILDSRIVRRRYGRPFLDSLPPARRAVGSQEEVLAALGKFFAALRG